MRSETVAQFNPKDFLIGIFGTYDIFITSINGVKERLLAVITDITKYIVMFIDIIV